MSRIGKQPVAIAEGVKVSIDGGVVTVEGALGKDSYKLPAGISAELKDGHVVVTRASDDRKVRGFHGLSRTLISNMIVGVTKGYEKNLEIDGVGFKAQMLGDKISLSLGFASPKEYTIPEGAKVSVDASGLKVSIKGIDKQLVGRVAADIRSYYPVEPYKGKGIHYAGEKFRRKEGKTVA